MIFYKTSEEVEYIRKSSLLVAKTLAEVAKVIKVGIKTKELDKVAETFILDNGALPAFKGYHGFPATLCISINDAVVHGIPGETELKDGDLVSVDCGVLMNGFYGDSAYSFAVGEVSQEVKDLLRITKESLYKGIENAVVGLRLGDIGAGVQNHVEQYGYGVVRELVGHGVGRNLHESPEVPNYGRQGSGIKLKEGLVIAIEPMVNMGKKEVVFSKDGWTVLTVDHKPSAHFEHTILVTNGKADILSDFEIIEKELKTIF